MIGLVRGLARLLLACLAIAAAAVFGFAVIALFVGFLLWLGVP